MDAPAGAQVQQGLETGRAQIEVRPAIALPSAPVALSESGTWKVQVGAFRNSRAVQERLHAIQKEVPLRSNLTPTAEAWGQVTRARVGGITDETAAAGLCARIITAGYNCFAVAPGN